MDDIRTTFHTRQGAEKRMGRMEEMFGAANMQLHKSRVSGDSMPDIHSMPGLRAGRADPAIILSDQKKLNEATDIDTDHD